MKFILIGDKILPMAVMLWCEHRYDVSAGHFS